MKPGIYYNPITLEMIEVIDYEADLYFPIFATRIYLEGERQVHIEKTWFRQMFIYLGAI
jgi:hypothetical protein